MRKEEGWVEIPPASLPSRGEIQQAFAGSEQDCPDFIKRPHMILASESGDKNDKNRCARKGCQEK
jgi:hypothetical protein